MNLFAQCRSRSLRMALIAGLTMATNWMPSCGLAQDRVGAIPVPAIGGPAMAIPSMGKIAGAKHYQLQQIFLIEIRRIDSATKLNDAQKTKLTVGAKGITKKLAQDFAASLDSMMALGPDNAGPAAVPVGGVPEKNNTKTKEIQIEEVKQFADIDPTAMMMLENPTGGKPTEDPNWSKIVKSVLTPEQFTKFEQLRTAEKEKADKAIVDAGVAALSLELLLSKEQEAKLIALVLEQIKKPKDKASSSVDFTMIMMEGMAFNSNLAAIDTKLLKEVLDPQQFELTEFKLSQTRQMLQAFGQGVGDTFIIEK